MTDYADLVQRLKDDHLRGCEGRTYRCTCGYDEVVEQAPSAIEALRGEVARLTEWAAALQTSALRQRLESAERVLDARLTDITRLTQRAEAAERRAEAAEAEIAQLKQREYLVDAPPGFNDTSEPLV